MTDKERMDALEKRIDYLEDRCSHLEMINQKYNHLDNTIPYMPRAYISDIKIKKS